MVPCGAARLVLLTKAGGRVSFEGLMANVKQKKTSRTRYGPSRNQGFYPDPDDYYFRRHFARLVREHGGKWIVLAEGKLIGIGKKDKIPGLVLKAQASYPKSAPFMAPIPTKEELECVL